MGPRTVAIGHLLVQGKVQFLFDRGHQQRQARSQLGLQNPSVQIAFRHDPRGGVVP